MFAGFSLILLGCLILGIIGVRTITNLSDMTASIFQHPFTVNRSILEVKADLLTAQKTVTKIAHNATPADLGSFESKLMELQVHADKNISVVRERYLGPQSDVDQLAMALVEWRAARNDIVDLIRNGRRAEAIALNDGRAAQSADNLLVKVEVVSDFAYSRAQKFKEDAERDSHSAVQIIFLAIFLTMVGGIAVALLITRSVRHSLSHAMVEVQRLIYGSAEKTRVAKSIGAGDLSQDITLSQPLTLDLNHLPNDELGELLKTAVQLSEMQCTLDESFAKMTASLRQVREIEQAADWLKTGLNELNSLVRDEQRTAEMASKVINYLVKYLNAGVGALYLFDERTIQLDLIASYAFTRRKNHGDSFALGDGLIGQAAHERKSICITNVPPGYLQIGSALGESGPAMVMAIPLIHGSRLIGALEIGSFQEFSDGEREFLELARVGIAIGLSVNISRQRMSELLEETQLQAEELRVQQEELQQSNEELEERAQMLEEQREKIRTKNQEIEVASENMRQKANELQQVSSYKSEFLANMSHELRTPLNSLMILSSLLKQNKDGNLNEKQVEFASTIHAAGTDLLNLINDILDLSKVEAGQMQFHIANIETPDISSSLRALFQPEAEQKQLNFLVDTATDVPSTFQGDEQRVMQILKNLLSNSFKFTEKGTISLHVSIPVGAENPLPVPAIAYAVSDTGIGISAEKQQLIFQAFQQADGSISRKFGGTGLGLSISLELARKMQGDIRMSSSEFQGSVFTLFMPLSAASVSISESPSRLPPTTPSLTHAGAGVFDHTPSLPDDRSQMSAGDKSILVIEDDVNFARILGDMIHKRGYAVLMAADGESGIALAEHFLPSAVILDVMLPRLDGWSVMRRLKDNPRTRHVPVYFLTCLEDRQKAMSMAALGFATKPVCTEQLNEIFRVIEGAVKNTIRKLLIVEDNADEAYSLVALLDDLDVEITVASTGSEAIALISTQTFNCIVLYLGLSDMSGFDLLEFIKKLDPSHRIPIIVHSGQDLSYQDERRLRKFAESIIIKGVKSPERLIKEVTLFLHQAESNLHPDKQRMIRNELDREAMLEDCKVLLVDDDMRNLFSISNLLAEKNMSVIEAENGREAISSLEANPDVDIILMDIMMPDTDGYTAMQIIRKDTRFAKIPIIAMTAKAMMGDYEKCMAAGASDYISKPIDVDKLLSLIRVWNYQRPEISEM